MASGSRVRGNVHADTDIDFYRFTAAGGDRIYAATMTGFSSAAGGATQQDTVIDVISTNGSTVLENDDNDGLVADRASSIAGTVIQTSGTYFLRVTQFDPSSVVRPYDLYLQVRSGSPTPETEPNNLVSEAQPVGGWMSGSTSSVTDVDLFALPLQAGDTVFLSLDLDPERDVVNWDGEVGLSSFGVPSSTVVAHSSTGLDPPNSEVLLLSVTSAGTYVVDVRPAGNHTFGTYHLSATVIPASTETCTRYASAGGPLAIPSGPSTVSSTLTIPDDVRIGRLTVAVDISHARLSDLDVHLTAPVGNTVGLFTDVGSAAVGAQTRSDFVLDDQAAVPVGTFVAIGGATWTPEADYRLDWFKGERSAGGWTLTVLDDTTDEGGTLEAWAVIVCSTPLPTGATLYSEDFELNDGGYTHHGIVDEWQYGTPTLAPIDTCNSGTKCWKTDLDGLYDGSSSQVLVSPPIALPAGGPLFLTWAQKFQMENSVNDNYGVVIGEVGIPSTQRVVYRFLDATMATAVGNPPVTVQEASGWGTQIVDVTALAGKTVEVTFNLGSNGVNHFAGVAIDDVAIIDGTPTSTADLSITKTDGVTSVVAGGSATYTITASNSGPSSVTGATVTDSFPGTITGLPTGRAWGPAVAPAPGPARATSTTPP